MFNSSSDSWYNYMQPFRIALHKHMILAQQKAEKAEKAEKAQQQHQTPQNKENTNTEN